MKLETNAFQTKVTLNQIIGFQQTNKPTNYMPLSSA